MTATRFDEICASALLLATLSFAACNDAPVSPTDGAGLPDGSASDSGSEPVACFTSEPSPAEVSVGEKVIVDAGCTEGVGPDATYRWDLGDGRRRTGPRVEARYPRAGDYVIELRVEDRGMQSTTTTAVRVMPRPAPTLNACFTFRDLTLAEETLPCSIAFDASCSTGEIQEYRWFFGGSPHVEGDDETLTTATPEAEHSWSGDMECRFFRPFERLVRLTTVDSRGRTHSVEQMIPFAHISRE
jgi:hypothetical protein